MIMNNGQNSRSYSPVPTNVQSSQDTENPKLRLKELVKEQLEHEILTGLVLADLSCAYWKMGLVGHKCKMHCKALEEFEENFDWRKYYHDVFDEIPAIEIHYESKATPKSLDEIHNKLYELHVKNKDRLHKILKLSQEAEIYEDMHILLEMYKKCEEHEEKLDAKMKRSQIFGYDVSYILAKDCELKDKYEKHRHESHEHLEKY